MPDELSYLSATDALSRFRTGELTPTQLLESTISRVEAVDGEVNAVSGTLFDSARQAAASSDHRYRDGTARPLEGLPVAIKEEQPIAGESWTEGSMLLKDRVSDITHPIVDRIVAAGGIPHLRTTVPEFCSAGFTHSDLWGVSRNPWNRAFSPGGSSGGSGAALAAGYAPLATGSDIAGSIRIPATFNGVVGFKPPYGRVPGLPPFNLDTYCADGPMARTVADCALLQNVIAGQHPADLASVPDRAPLDVQPGVAGRRIALCINLGNYPVDGPVEAAVRAAAQGLRDAGAVVDEIELDWHRDEIMAAAWTHYGTILTPFIVMEAEGSSDLMPYTTEVVQRAANALERHGSTYALEIEGRIHHDLAAVFADYDALVCPTVGAAGFIAGEDYVDTALVVDGVSLGHPFESLLTVPFNLASRCPVLTVPVGHGDAGVPVGMQIVGRPYDDQSVFDIGGVVEQLHPWYREPAWRPVF